MIIYPAIDLIGGAVVRLHKGDFDQLTTYGDDPVSVAQSYADAGATWLHLVDLDGAKNPDNRQIDLIANIISSTGLRDRNRIIAIGCQLVKIAFMQPHNGTANKVNRRINDHDGISRKLRRICAPTRPDFSGWN